MGLKLSTHSDKNSVDTYLELKFFAQDMQSIWSNFFK